jgi:hypothetical protein
MPLWAPPRACPAPLVNKNKRRHFVPSPGIAAVLAISPLMSISAHENQNMTHELIQISVRVARLMSTNGLLRAKDYGRLSSHASHHV